MSLVRHFARRMAPLAILAGLVVAVVPPVTYRQIAGRELSDQAAIYAEQIAHRLREAIAQQPLLWPYNADKILQATVPHGEQKDIAAIEIRDCHGDRLPASVATVLGTGSRRGPVRSVPVVVHGQVAAIVSVQIDQAEHRVALRTIGLLSTLLGLMMGLLLYFFPTRVVRRQSRELSLSARVVEIQEEERRRIARDLHDGVGQAITGLQMELELAHRHPDQGPERLQRSIDTCAETLGELRRVVQEIRPPELDRGEVVPALRAYAEQFERRTGIATYFHSEGNADCPKEIAIGLLRVMQEALTNVKRHASASEVGIKLKIEGGLATLEITDDGCGFDPDRETDGTGLRGMRERCEYLGGRLTVESTATEGARLVAALPLHGETR